MISNILELLISVISDFKFLLLVASISFLSKAYILIILLMQRHKKTLHKPLFFLLLVLIGAMIDDSAWMLKLSYYLFLPMLNYKVIALWIRIAWAFMTIKHQALALFSESLVMQSYHLSLKQKIFVCLSSIFFIVSLGMPLFYSNALPSFANNIDFLPSLNSLSLLIKDHLEYVFHKVQAFYSIILLLFSTLFIIIKRLPSRHVPRILNQQLKIITFYFIVPHLVMEILQAFFAEFNVPHTIGYTIVSSSTILLSVALFYWAKKMIGLRFLNFNSHVQTKINFNFITNFQGALDQLSSAVNVHELGHITKSLLHNTLEIPTRFTTLYIRPYQHQDTNNTTTHTTIETALSIENSIVYAALTGTKILVYDEIAFNTFYNSTQENKVVMNFLNHINADIFLPIYQKNKVIAYIIIERFARPNKLYGKAEQDEMTVFAGYLGNVIHLLQSRNLEDLIHREKEMQEEIYKKHKENNQYKESIHSFINDTEHREIGIIFYKNRHFVFGNKAAKELIEIDINKQSGHPITKSLKKLARNVEEYKAPQSTIIRNERGKKLVISGVQHLEKNNVIIQVYYPEISDIIKRQIDLLQDPTKWDYLLYLETTQSGKLIDKLFPSSGKSILNFKISLLQAALSKKAILLEMPPDDLMPTVELLHHISLREQLHVFSLHGPQTTCDDAVKLFGINKLFNFKPEDEPLLKKLNAIGTLFIQNIQLLNLETQEYLAEFIRYGFYRPFKSEQKIASNVRIICSTNQDLKKLAYEGTFSKALLNELRSTSISMPSLVTLPDHELTDLTDGLVTQALEAQTFKNFLELTDRDKKKFVKNRPSSLKDLKNKVHTLLIQKSRENKIYQEIHFDPAYDISDPQLLEAARLGKQALRDPKIMAMLWNKFKNQNTIATLLGVNRSSVNRRCKKYGL